MRGNSALKRRSKQRFQADQKQLQESFQDMRPTLILFFLSLMLANPAFSQSTAGADAFSAQASAQNLQTETFLRVEEAYQVLPELNGKQISLPWSIAPKYYLYKDRFKASAFIDGEYKTLPATYEAGLVKYDEVFQKEVEVFYNSTEVLIEDQSLPESFTLKVTSQGCADAGLCYPPRHQYYDVNFTTANISETSKPAAVTAEAPSSANAQESSAWLPYILLLAIAGGAILNLMPCVFPVLSIKALSIANAQGDHKGHGWAYTAGSVSAFVLVAALMLAARAGGQSVGWGFQLQSPVLVSLLAYLFFVMGLSLSGLANFGASFMGAGQQLTESGGLKGSFFTGVLAAVVASPCTAPFMGTALGYALTQPAAVSLSVFGALGFGMALPFLLICHSPRLSHWLPKPGAWMDTLKQCLAFPLYLAAVWLLWVLGRQAGSDNMALLVIGAIFIAFALWLKEHSSGGFGKAIALAAALFALALPFQLMPYSGHQSGSNDQWKPYQAANFEAQKSSGRPILVNLTADWCITCLANERVVLSNETIESALTNLDVLTIKGDWTNYNAEITTLLNKHGRSGVPLYLVFPASGTGEPRILPQILSTDVMLSALEYAAKN